MAPPQSPPFSPRKTRSSTSNPRRLNAPTTAATNHIASGTGRANNRPNRPIAPPPQPPLPPPPQLSRAAITEDIACKRYHLLDATIKDLDFVAHLRKGKNAPEIVQACTAVAKAPEELYAVAYFVPLCPKLPAHWGVKCGKSGNAITRRGTLAKCGTELGVVSQVASELVDCVDAKESILHVFMRELLGPLRRKNAVRNVSAMRKAAGHPPLSQAQINRIRAIKKTTQPRHSAYVPCFNCKKGFCMCHREVHSLPTTTNSVDQDDDVEFLWNAVLEAFIDLLAIIFERWKEEGLL